MSLFSVALEPSKTRFCEFLLFWKDLSCSLVFFLFVCCLTCKTAFPISEIFFGYDDFFVDEKNLQGWKEIKQLFSNFFEIQ